MAHPTLDYIRGLRKSLETKKAEIVGTPPSSIPGSEHDGKPPAEAKEPDKETKDQTMVPNSGLNTSGAGDDSKITHTNDLLAGEAALTPTKKPEVTSDADAKTAESLAAEIITGVDAWYAAKEAAAKEAASKGSAADAGAAAEGAAAKPAEQQGAEQKTASDTPPAAGAGTAEALITDKGKEPEQTKDVIPPTKKPEVTTDATVPATGEGSSGETAAAAKAAGAAAGECTCGKCEKCKAKAAQAAKDAKDCKDAKPAKAAGALDMELTSDVLAKIAAVMLATEEGTKLAESVLAKAAGAEAAEKTLNFLREQNDLAEKQAEFNAGRQDAINLILKQAQDAEAAEALAAAGGGDDGGAGGDDGGIAEIADTLDAMVESGEITEDEADQVVVELAQALADGGGAGNAGDAGDAGAAAAPAAADAGGEKAAQAAPDAAAAAAPAAGDAAIDQTVAVDPSQLDPNSVPQGGVGDISPDDVADAIDTLVQSGEITEDEADQLVQEIVGGDAGAGADGDGDGAAGDVNPEEIATALQEAVASGELTPQDVQQVLGELEGVPAPEEGAAAAAPAADAGAAAAAAPAAADAAAGAPTDEPKTAESKLIAAINAARAARAAAK